MILDEFLVKDKLVDGLLGSTVRKHQDWFDKSNTQIKQLVGKERRVCFQTYLTKTK